MEPRFFPPSRRLVIVLVNYAVLVFLDVSFSSARAYFLSTPIEHGGLGMNPRTIGIILGAAGPIHGMAQAFLFKHVHKRWDMRTIYAVCMVAYVPTYLSLPVMNVLARQVGHVTPLVWGLIVLMELLCTFAYTAFSMSTSLLCPLNLSHKFDRLCVCVYNPSRTFPYCYGKNSCSSSDRILLDGWHWPSQRDSSYGRIG